MTVEGQKCTYRKQVREELLDDAVAEVISKVDDEPKFAAMMQERINRNVDTAAIKQEIEAQEKVLRQAYSTKKKLTEEIDSFDPDDRHYMRKKTDLDDRLYSMYDKIDEAEDLLISEKIRSDRWKRKKRLRKHWSILG